MMKLQALPECRSVPSKHASSAGAWCSARRWRVRTTFNPSSH